MTTCSDKAGSILDVDCIYENGEFIMGTLPGCLPSLFTARFRAPTDYSAGDVVVVKGKKLPVRTPGMTAAASDIFKAGAVIHCDIDLDRELAFFWQGNGGSMILPNLSYVEQFAGFYDVDGSKVYVKTIDLGVVGPAGSKTIPHGIPNVKSFVSVNFRTGKNGQETFGCASGPTSYLVISTDITNVRLAHTYAAANSDTKVRGIFYYTCTDR